MRAGLKGTMLASFAGFAFTGGVIAAMQVAALAAMLMASQADFSPAVAAKPLLHTVALKPDASAPAGFSAREKHNIEDTVRTQLRAYAARDAEKAFAKLAPSTQHFFGKPDKFLLSLAQETPAILDTRHFAFLGVERSGERAVQQVLITDGSGQEWLAEFQLEQLGSDWRIRGCIVQSTPGQQA